MQVTPLNVHVTRSLFVHMQSGPVPLSAASGLVQLGRRLYVVADDENQLAVFDLQRGQQPGELLHLFDGVLSTSFEARKSAKPDLEALTQLPAFPGFPHGALLALGSGSRPQRRRAALLKLDEQGDIREPVRVIDLSPLYIPLQSRNEALNIEGAFVNGEQFCLLQRGNAANPTNALISFDRVAIMDWLLGTAPAPEAISATEFDLGQIDGVPLCFTDGAALPDGGWAFCAVAEATSDNYADGPCRGSAVGIVGRGGRLVAVHRLEMNCKTEGIAATIANGLLRLMLVTDADDRSSPALLLEVELPSSAP